MRKFPPGLAIWVLLWAVLCFLGACSTATTPGTPSPSPSATSQGAPSPSASGQPAASPTAVQPSATVSDTWARVAHLTCPGRVRWPVKTGTDQDAGKINLSVVEETTIGHLVSLPKPAHLPQNARVAPTELTVFQVKAMLTAFKLEPDQDYHLVLEDAGQTMIAEIPDPACTGPHSRLLPGIERARAQFEARYHASPDHFTDVHEPVTVTGVGFFDFDHGQRGVAGGPEGNAIEIHPVLDITFGR